MKIRFGQFTLDLDTRQLARGKREIHLASKAYELLATLLLDRPKVLSKAVLQERLWPRTFVAEANLSNLVAEIREALVTGPASLISSGPHTVWLRVLRDATSRARGTGSTLVLAQWGIALSSSSWTRFGETPMSRSGSMHRRSPAVTRASW